MTVHSDKVTKGKCYDCWVGLTPASEFYVIVFLNLDLWNFVSGKKVPTLKTNVFVTLTNHCTKCEGW